MSVDLPASTCPLSHSILAFSRAEPTHSPITTKLTPRLSAWPCSAWRASSNTFSLAIVIFGGGSSSRTGSSPAFRFSAEISSDRASVARTGVDVPDFFPAPGPFFGAPAAEPSLAPVSAAFFCCASFCAFSAFSRSFAAKIYCYNTSAGQYMSCVLRKGEQRF